MTSKLQQVLFSSVFVATLGCEAQPEHDVLIEEGMEDEVGSEDDLGFRGVATYNGLALGNGLRFTNGFTLSNGFSVSNGLAVGNGLSLSNGLAYSNGLSASNGFMTHSAGRQLIKYIVECALPSGDYLSKNGYIFYGKIGLAPEWKYGSCGTACQEWVSACLLARTNEYGLTVNIDMRADDPAIGTAPGNWSFTEQEGAFFGNLFRSPPVAYSCRGPDWLNAYYHWRDCTWDGTNCGMKNVNYGDCYQYCYGVYASDGSFIYTYCPNSNYSSRLYYNAVINTFLPRY